jgi:hypothetical protein
MDTAEMEQTLRESGIRFYRNRAGGLFCAIAPAELECEDVQALGFYPSTTYARNGRGPQSADGYKLEREWRGGTEELHELACLIADEQAAARKQAVKPTVTEPVIDGVKAAVPYNEFPPGYGEPEFDEPEPKWEDAA